jgi:hypothetical protein
MAGLPKSAPSGAARADMPRLFFESRPGCDKIRLATRQHGRLHGKIYTDREANAMKRRSIQPCEKQPFTPIPAGLVLRSESFRQQIYTPSLHIL